MEKAFKADAAGNPVTLLGISSPYTALNGSGQVRTQPIAGHLLNLSHRLPGAEANPMVVLGVTNALEMHSLMKRFKDIADIEMPVAHRISEMPAWSWDYPGFHYRQRDEALVNVRQEFERHREPLMQRLLACAPPVLAALLDLDVPASAMIVLDAQQRGFLQAMRLHWRLERQRRREARQVPRLPWLYLFTLHAWLQWRLAGQPSKASCISRLFQWAGNTDDGTVSAGSHGLASNIGVIDPARTLDALLAALALLDETLSAATLVGMTRFTLQSNGIFRSTFADGKKRTLIAHCGGKQPNFVDCGNWPLIYGKSESCACGRLICKLCHSCTTVAVPCVHEQERKARIFRDTQGSAMQAHPISGKRTRAHGG